MEKAISPVEIEGKWTLGMVLDANDALDLQDEANRRAREREKPDGGMNGSR